MTPNFQPGRFAPASASHPHKGAAGWVGLILAAGRPVWAVQRGNYAANNKPRARA
jgi:hypothetical protein